MQLHRLRLTEFRQFEDAELAFDEGLMVLFGPSASGKSTLLEAVVWALFGAGSVRRSEESLRRVRAPDRVPAAVELEFTAAGRHCALRRSTTGTQTADATLSLDGHVVASGVDDVAAVVAGDLGILRDRFMHACFTGRKELHQLAQLGPVDRMRFLARTLGEDASRTARAAGGSGDGVADAIAALERELAESDERVRTLATAPDLLAQYTGELERLRPELQQAEAEAQRLHDDWAQKRQEVDTKLDAYARRAEELKRQIERLSREGDAGVCPTCERPLGPHAERMVARLDDEHYVNAQDTKWLLQRQRQLANKPPDLVQAETRQARLRASVDDRAQRAARCEQATQELWTVASERQRTVEQLEALKRDPSIRRTRQPRTLRRETLGELADLAGWYLGRITGGRYTGIALTPDGRIYAVADGTPTPVVSGSDEDAIALVLRLATMQLAGAGQDEARVLLLDEPFGSMDADRRRRAVDVLRGLLTDCPQIIISTRQPDIGAQADHIRHVEYDVDRRASTVHLDGSTRSLPLA
ncbi:MAG TPA: AAA family ATPase [Longimicrobiales bacterium]|nr:AAA family ATPase [Longimicrobiales bacterium]